METAFKFIRQIFISIFTIPIAWLWGPTDDQLVSRATDEDKTK